MGTIPNSHFQIIFHPLLLQLQLAKGAMFSKVPKVTCCAFSPGITGGSLTISLLTRGICPTVYLHALAYSAINLGIFDEHLVHLCRLKPYKVF